MVVLCPFGWCAAEIFNLMKQRESLRLDLLTFARTPQFGSDGSGARLLGGSDETIALFLAKDSLVENFFCLYLSRTLALPILPSIDSDVNGIHLLSSYLMYGMKYLRTGKMGKPLCSRMKEPVSRRDVYSFVVICRKILPATLQKCICIEGSSTQTIHSDCMLES